MRSNSTLSPVFVNIANNLFFQLQAFGQLGSKLQTNSEFLSPALVNKFAFAQAYFQLLELEFDLQFNEREIPLLYNTAEWPDSAPLAGFVSFPSIIKPSDMVSSFFMSWEYFWASQTSGGSWLRRPLKAALWICHHQSFEDAITYLLSLHRYGLNLEPDSTADCVNILLKVYQAVGQNEEIIPHFFNGHVPDNDKEWIRAEISFGQDSAVINKNHKIIRSNIDDILMLIVSTTLDHIEETRSTTSADTWLLNQFTINSSISTAQQVLKLYVKDFSLSLQAVYDQIEEIRADSGGIIRYILAQFKINDGLIAPLHIIDTVKKILMAKSPNDWQIRIMQERAILPYDLKPYYIENIPLEIPKNWKLLSDHLAPIFLIAIRRVSGFSLYRKSIFPYEFIYEQDVAHEVLENHGIDDEFCKKVIFKVAADEGNKFRFESDIINLKREIESLSEKNKSKDVKDDTKINFEDDEFEINKESIKKWLGENEKFFDEIVDEIRHQLYRAEILNTLDRVDILKKDQKINQAISDLEQLAENYPWNHSIIYELSIAYDENNLSEKALSLIENAIAADPLDPNMR